MTEATHGVPGFGELGADPDEVERHRVEKLDTQALTTRQAPPADDSAALRAVATLRPQIALVLRQELSSVRAEINSIAHDIRTNSEMVRTLDVPLEQVADSHERASKSFENLRHEISDVSARLGAVEQVIDTAGLKRAQEGAEARFTRLADLLEKTIAQLLRVQGGMLERARERLEKKKPRRK